MRDLEFLPWWYPALRRNKRLLVWQSWIALGMVLALAGQVLAQRWQVRHEEEIVHQYSAQLAQTNGELAQVVHLQQQKKLFRGQQQTLEKLGLHVEATRLFSLLEGAMPPEMALLGVNVDTDDAAADRRLHIRLQGVTPDDVQVATLLANLHAIKFFDEVDMSYVRDRFERGHALREFEVSFVIHLGKPANGK